MKSLSILVASLFLANSAFAQNVYNLRVLNSDSLYRAAVPNSGRIWGYYFGDFYFKSKADALQRGGANQYTGIPSERTAFQSRRIYLGYDYNITSKFSAELLLAAEDNFPTGNPPSSTSASGDLLSDTRLSFYIKLANIRWKQIWKGTDLIVGQIATPAFTLLTEKIWNYRSIEKTITDNRKTPSFDMGAALQGVWDPATKNIGYDLMVGNGHGAKPEADNFKWFYGDIYAYLFDKKIVVDVYADYERLNWTLGWHHSRSMLKGFIAYNSSATKKGMDPGTGYTVGLEFFTNYLHNDVFAVKNIAAHNVDTLSNRSVGISLYVHGDIVPNKLRFFSRLDLLNPMKNIDTGIYGKFTGNTSCYNDNSYIGGIPTGDDTYKQVFITAGLDFMPVKNVHFLPNIWYNSYASQLPGVAGSTKHDNDFVYRLTMNFLFGK